MIWPEHLKCQVESPASDDDITKLLASVFAPLTYKEIDSLISEHEKAVGEGSFDPPFDPSAWKLPKPHLPESYLNFLRFSNGGYFAGTSRDLDPLFAANQVREYMLAYSIPRWMPLSCPIGFDGGGTFYLLDMRDTSSAGEYPILFSHAGNLGYEDAVVLADSFASLVATNLGQS